MENATQIKLVLSTQKTRTVLLSDTERNVSLTREDDYTLHKGNYLSSETVFVVKFRDHIKAFNLIDEAINYYCNI